MNKRCARLTFVFAFGMLCCNGCGSERGNVSAPRADSATAAVQPARVGSAGAAASSSNGLPRLRCTKQAAEGGLACGDQTCPAPSGADAAQCIVSCCLIVDGAGHCGTASTAAGFSSECALHGDPDLHCDDVPQWQGCCDPVQHICGVLLPLQSGCVTKTNFTTLPEHPKACGTTD